MLLGHGIATPTSLPKSTNFAPEPTLFSVAHDLSGAYYTKLRSSQLTQCVPWTHQMWEPRVSGVPDHLTVSSHFLRLCQTSRRSKQARAAPRPPCQRPSKPRPALVNPRQSHDGAWATCERLPSAWPSPTMPLSQHASRNPACCCCCIQPALGLSALHEGRSHGVARPRTAGAGARYGAAAHQQRTHSTAQASRRTAPPRR